MPRKDELCNDLTTVKPGDTLLVSTVSSWRLVEVTRLTATQVVTGAANYETRYRKTDGRIIGGDHYYGAMAFLYDAVGQARWRELKQEHTRKVLQNRIQDTKWRDADDATLQTVAQTLLAAGLGPDTLCEALSEFQRYAAPAAAVTV